MSTKILLIEDDTILREGTVDLLMLSGFLVESASDGKEGILKAVLNNPDIILCDINMPTMDGIQVLDNIRNTRSLANIPFIFLTGQSDQQDQRRGMLLGADDYLTKPFTEDSLLQSIQSRLKREDQRRALLQDQLNAQYDKLSRVTGHEYNTPLSGVIGFSTLLVNYYDDFEREDAITMLQSVRECGFRLKRSLDNVQLINILQTLAPSHPNYSCYASGQSKISTSTIVDQFEQIAGAQENTLNWLVDIEEAQLTISSKYLEQIVREVLDNSVKFSKLPATVSVIGKVSGYNYQLIVSNTGRYFKSEDIANIGPFRQFGREQFEQQGMGIGLAITNKLLELNGGCLEVESQPSGQTTVTMTLPTIREH